MLPSFGDFRQYLSVNMLRFLAELQPNKHLLSLKPVWTASKYASRRIFASLILAIITGANTSYAIQETEWSLTQKIRDGGTCTVKLSRQSVRVESAEGGFVAICKGPDWHVDCFRPKERRWWRGELHDFSGAVLINPVATPWLSLAPMEKQGIVKYCGTNCREYFPKDKRSFVLLASDEICVDVKIAEFLCRYTHVPKIEQVPLYRRSAHAKKAKSSVSKSEFITFNDIGEDLRARPQITLETTSIRRGNLNPADFELPPGLSRVKSVTKIILSDEKTEGFGELMKEFGNTSGIDRVPR